MIAAQERKAINMKALKLSDTLYMNEVFSEEEALNLASQRIKEQIPDFQQAKLEALEKKGETFKNYYFSLVKEIFGADDLKVINLDNPKKEILESFTLHRELTSELKIVEQNHGILFSYSGYICPILNKANLDLLKARDIKNVYNALDYAFVSAGREFIMGEGENDYETIFSKALEVQQSNL